MSAAVGVSTTSTPSGAGTARLDASSVTLAPRRLASTASATPIRPEERLPRKRTASSGSRVPPALTRTIGRRGSRREYRAALRSERRSPPARLMRPRPTSPSASSPASGPISSTPRARRVAAFACVASCSHMRVFIAGATSTGPRCASAASVRTSSASPCASFASVCAVSGAITSRSARARCGYGSTLGDLRASAKKVSARTKRSEPRVGSGSTSWPALTSSRTSSQAL